MKIVTGMIVTVIAVLFHSAWAQDKPAQTAPGHREFLIQDASKQFDIKIATENCIADKCVGKATYSFYNKGSTTFFQTIAMSADSKFPDYACVWLDRAGRPFINQFGYVDDQAGVNVGDYNFDGRDDIALCKGSGQYSMPAYEVYLSSGIPGKFEYSKAFTESLGHGLGMFDIDTTHRTLSTIGKSGCCWHITKTYAVSHNAPQKIKEEVWDATIGDRSKTKITTKKLVNGKWKTTVRWEATQ